MKKKQSEITSTVCDSVVKLLLENNDHWNDPSQLNESFEFSIECIEFSS